MSIINIYDEVIKFGNLDMDKIYDILVKKYNESKVNFIMYDIFKYVPPTKQNYEKRRDQKTFRKNLIKRYRGCIITDTDEEICEACHIIPFSKCLEVDKYNVNNGLLLRRDLHTLFDNGNLKINHQTSIIELSDKILSNPKMKKYKKYHNKKINIHHDSIEYLKKIY